ncbi:hypothetical protein [Cellulosimicrobium sp. Marseille-Q4280]|uniref:hypothetical protein n=1 Tax=Cellulosimicrobium sp. Marseille-Q4280 TaxID=2937992 RepID=UPI00333C3E9B
MNTTTSGSSLSVPSPRAHAAPAARRAVLTLCVAAVVLGGCAAPSSVPSVELCSDLHPADVVPGPGEVSDHDECVAGVQAGLAAERPDTVAVDDLGRMLDDPTSDGQITARTAQVMDLALAEFPGSSWSCWSPRPGTRSEHPLGRACDVTYGNALGEAATGDALEQGWAMTAWLQTHAEVLGVDYVIWQGGIWSSRWWGAEWRPYDGGGMHDPAAVTGGHFDHLHVTVRG